MKKTYVLSSFFLLVFAFVSKSQSPGSLDPTFSTTGFASYGPVASNYFDNAQDVVTLPDGKILFCGTSGIIGNLDICVVRLNADGTIDNTFGTNGYYLHPNTLGSDFAYDMEVLSDGNILVGGALAISASNPQFAIVCLRPEGTLNPTFGINGVFTNDIDGGEDYARKMLISSTNITLVGSSKIPGFTTSRIAVTRCDLSGILDLSFGSSGKTILTNGNSNTVYSACLTSNNEIIACGDAYISNSYHPMLAKMDANGNVASTFGTNGIWTGTIQFSRYYDIDQVNGNLLVSGSDGDSFTDFIIQCRQENDASLVSNFGVGGTITTNLNDSDTYYELLVHPDGSILACGTTGTLGIGAARDFVISKYTSTGILETSWGSNGHTITSIYSNWDDAYGMDLYPNDRIVVAGFSAQTNTQFAVARYIYSNSSFVYGCMNPDACNYNPSATFDDGSCMLPGDPCNDGNPNTMNDSINSDCGCVGVLIVEGCMNPDACNYNPLANVDDNMCVLPGSLCDDNNPNTMNDSINSNCECVGVLIVEGCMNPDACNYNVSANVDNNSCILPGDPCDDGNAMTINDSINPNCECIGTNISGLVEVSHTLSIHPNPVNTTLIIKLDEFSSDLTIKLVDVQGRILLEQSLLDNELELNVSNFVNGTYFIQLASKEYVLRQKLIIEH
jgi:uncharacterized delta-60 repeat protein